jgi:hypothetical protein
MNTIELADVLERSPFRPFTLRLLNGATYEVRRPRDVGAPGDLRALYWFESDPPFRVVRIERDAIAEIIE